MPGLTGVIAERPRYDGRSSVNLLASLVADMGGVPLPYARLEQVVSENVVRKHVVLLVVDGLGYDFLTATAAMTVAREHLASRMTTVFPPTTASAVTSLLTGLAPQQHGLTGWFTYFRELDRVVTVLPFKARETGESLARLGVDPGALFDHEPLFNRIPRPCFSIMPQEIAYSPFNLAHSGRASIHTYRNLDGMFAAVESMLVGASEPAYIYAYWSELDHLAHQHGIASLEVASHAGELDAALGRFLERISGRDVLVLLTADHGFVDIAPGAAIELDTHRELRAMLRMPLCGEPRTAYCYVKPGREADFQRYVESALGGRVDCVASAELLEAGYFGPGEAHPELAYRVGDFALLAHAGVALFDRGPEERAPLPRGVHGGGSTAEIGVPLVVAEP